MKNLNFLSLLMILALLFAVQPASAVVSVRNSNETATATVSKKELKKQNRMEKMVDKIQKKMDKLTKKGIDKNDPTGKWLWFAIILGIAAIIASILFYSTWLVVGLWFLPSLLWAAASICFLIWLLKYLEVM
ncbi:MAG: hypothetical protein H6563_15230 [Lewinellaceae bacterium]|nr:hypothetical protein [Lewinellaceae bacterium]